MGRTRFVVVIGVVALLLGACGDKTSNSGAGSSGTSDRTSEDQAYVDELTGAIQSSSGQDDSIPKDQAQCWVDDMVDGIGVDKMKQAGFTPEAMSGNGDQVDFKKLSEGDRKVVADSFTECVDLKQVFMESLDSSGQDLTPEMKECFEGIDWKVIEQSFAEMILSGDDLDENDPAMAPLLGCMMMGLGDMDMEDMDTSTTIG